MKSNNWIKVTRFVLGLCIASVFMLHMTQWMNIPLLKRLDNIAFDLRLNATLPNTVDPRIVILDIDEKSLDIEGHWPWSRNKLSELVDILFDHYQIKLLAFDITFPEKDTTSGLHLFEKLAATELKNDAAYLSSLDKLRPQLKYDELFTQSLRDRNIVLGYFTSLTETPIRDDTALPTSLANADDYHFTDALIHAKSYGANLTSLQQAAEQGGFFNNPLVDKDGTYRRLPLLNVINHEIYESLALAIFRNIIQEPVQFNANHDYDDTSNSRLESISIGSFTIPVDEQSVIVVPYRGKQGSFQYISATDALNFATEDLALKDKIVILGSSAAGIMDLRSTPVQHIFPGVEIHANIVSGLLDQRIKYRPSYIVGIQFIFILVLSVIGLLFFPRLSAYTLSFILVVLLTTILVVNVYLWHYQHMDIPLATPILFVGLLFSLQITFSFLQESRHKKEITGLFGQYVPPEIVDEMADKPDSFSMDAHDKELTVLFSDVRGFTSISESLEANELSALINEILSPVTKIIHTHKGTIDKYMGDAVMAFWGSPKPNPFHASDAVRAALEISPAMKQLDKTFLAKGWPSINMGVGLNTGNMSVGNMGSEFRVAYTVLGDAVNLGSRLEGLTKQYGVKIIVSESTKNAAPEFTYKELDRVRVKGKLEPIAIFEPLDLTVNIKQETLKSLTQHTQALIEYRSQHWQQAEIIFTQLQQQAPEQLINKIYLERIQLFKAAPPEADWDGTFTHTSK